MKKYFIFALCAMLSVGMLTGCGSKKKTESAEKRLEKTFKAYSLDKTADSSDVEAVDNVTIVGNFNIKASEGTIKSKVEFKIDLEGQEFYLGGNVSIDDDKFGFDVYGTTDANDNGVFYVRADELMEDWLAITFNGEDMGLEDEEDTDEEFSIDELLKVDFSSFKDIKEIETKDGITKISAKLDLTDAYDEDLEDYGMDFDIPELTIYFYIDEDNRLTKIEFDGDELIKSGMFDSFEFEVEEVEFSLEFKDYGKTTISIPSEAKNTENTITAEDLLTSIFSMFIAGLDEDYDYDFDFDYDFDWDDDDTISYNSEVDGLEIIDNATY